MRIHWVLGFGLIFISLGIGVFHWVQENRVANVEYTETMLKKEDIETTLRARIQEVGPIQAREELKVLYDSASITDAHNVGHVLGRLLFEEFDKAGLGYCDMGFTFGCYHEFFARVIHRDGIGIVSELNHVCFSSQDRLANAFACQHGIGHGLQVHGGYEVDALKDALSICHTLRPLDSINGCYGGAVMEYNMKTMQLAHEVPPREFVPEEGYMFPCTEIQEFATQACYYWQSQWWLFALQLEPVKVGELCREIESDENRSACFFGIGNRIPDLTVSPQKAVDLCVVFAGGSSDTNYLDCIASTAVTYAESGLSDHGQEVCQSVVAENRAFRFCERIRRNEG